MPISNSSASGARRAAAMTAVLAIILTACGQKAGVHVDNPGTFAAPGVDVAAPNSGDPATLPAGTSPSSAEQGPGTSTSPGQAGPAAGTPQGQSPSATNPNSATPNTTGPAQSGQPAQQGEAAVRVRGNDRTGVTADTIKIGSHAPVTGAAPLPSTSFEKSGDLYWRELVDKGGDVLGRTKVELIFRDDRYDPNAARQVCRELAAEVFTFGGGGGTDQIQACGAFAEQAKVPYFSAGVTEAGLRGNPWYFAASMSYKQQAPILAQLIKTNPDTKGKRVGAIITDTPNFDDAITGWEQAVKDYGLDYYKTLLHPKGDTSWYNSYLSDFADNGVEVVFILSSPVDYIRFAQQSKQAQVDFQYVGVGISMGLNAVLGSGCGNMDVHNGIFFSPFPGLDWAAQNVPEFFEAGQKFGVPTDDIAFALWGLAESLHITLAKYGEVYGNDLTREDFRDHVEKTSVKTKVFPAVSYSPENHFGASTVHVLQADCNTKQYKTLHTFASAF